MIPQSFCVSRGLNSATARLTVERCIRKLAANLASEWALPASQKWTELGGYGMSDEYAAKNRYIATTLTWVAALVTGLVCFLGFWYQKMMRRAVALEIDRC